MSRDKQIEEMAKSIASTPIGTVKPDLTLTEMGEVYNGEFIGRIAKHLVFEGYRKSEEVAREIFEEIEKLLKKNELRNYEPCNVESYYSGELEKDLAELKKKYTEEGK